VRRDVGGRCGVHLKHSISIRRMLVKSAHARGVPTKEVMTEKRQVQLDLFLGGALVCQFAVKGTSKSERATLDM
jgi:hypothetical protein